MERLFVKSGVGYKEVFISGEGGLILETNNSLQYKFGKAHKTYSIVIPNIGSNNTTLDNLFFKVDEHTVVFDDVFYLVEEGVYLKGILKIYNFNKSIAKGQFISLNSQLWEELKNTRLNEIDYVDASDNPMTFVLDESTIDDSDSLDLFDGDIIMDLIDRGRAREHADTFSVSLDGVTNVISNGLDIPERFPAVRVKRILKNIFKDYTLTGNFFDNAFYDKMYLLYTGERTNTTNTSIFVENNKFTAAMSEDFVSTNSYTSAQFGFNVNFELDFDDVKDNVNNVFSSSTGTFTVGEDGVYDMKYALRGTANITGSGVAIAEGSIKLQILNAVNDDVLYEREVPHTYLDGLIPQNEIVGDFSVILSTGDILLTTGLEYKTRVNFNAVVTGSSSWERTIKINRSGSYFRVNPSTYYGYGSTVETKKIMPNTLVSEFIKSILKEFNVELYVSQETNQVIFYQRRFDENVINLTPYILEGTIEVQLNPDKTNWIFKHKVDNSDRYFSTIYNNDPSINGEVNVNIGADRTESFISEFSMTAEVPINKWQIESNARLWSSFEEPNLSTNFNQRLLFEDGLKSCDYDLITPEGRINKTEYRVLSTSIAGFNYKFNEGLFSQFHEVNVDNITEGFIVTLDLDLQGDIISNFYNLTNNYWLNMFYINTPIVKGYFVLMSLVKKHSTIYTARLYKATSIGAIGEFSTDFFEDFNI